MNERAIQARFDQLDRQIMDLRRRLASVPAQFEKSGTDGGGGGNRTSPKTVGSAAEGSEAAESTTWDRDSDAKAVDVWVASRDGYFDAGDQKLYGYARKWQFDSAGCLYHITEETRYEIDVPVT